MQFASTEKCAGDEEDQEIGTNLKRPPPLREGPNYSKCHDFPVTGKCFETVVIFFITNDFETGRKVQTKIA